METTIGILFGFIAMLGFGLGNAIAKVPIQKIGSEKTIFYRNVIISILLFLILIFFGQDAVFSTKYILLAFLIAGIGYIPLLFFYKALNLGKVGVVSPVANSSAIFTVLFSIIFFYETISIDQGLAIAIIILGIILISLNPKDLKNSQILKISSGVPYALITSVLWGLVFFLWKIPVNVLGPILTVLIIEFGTMLCSATHIYVTKKDFRLPNKRILKYLFFISLGGAIGGLFFNMGIQRANVSIVSPIAAAAPLVATLYGKFVFKEKISKLQYLAIFIIIIGVVLVSYLSK
ncbi:MAG: DMT family transporter [Candidatus Komeilibacteria bacterium]|jgi:bacterial/archaeal transporter family protein|nr:DMT family transporter [Candidatus Komeilibacteria bacterium]MBT4447484.1 DMT family transporter [Candidatus Komeilibacteria bacterium]